MKKIQNFDTIFTANCENKILKTIHFCLLDTISEPAIDFTLPHRLKYPLEVVYKQKLKNKSNVSNGFLQIRPAGFSSFPIAGIEFKNNNLHLEQNIRLLTKKKINFGSRSKPFSKTYFESIFFKKNRLHSFLGTIKFNKKTMLTPLLKTPSICTKICEIGSVCFEFPTKKKIILNDYLFEKKPIVREKLNFHGIKIPIKKNYLFFTDSNNRKLHVGVDILVRTNFAILNSEKDFLLPVFGYSFTEQN